ncbi:uncharacterized protein EDB91DRAFT_1147085 [Suillus paluster]|uniref:uncharacterized protein n=1 Tax=Suillus paluster TaxID=48578 RepID=UPI001B8767A3|nr:uncharacterized protein EDB91DRAFT_1147085 [Suillus paluster]KAG1734227.1 hypothetical protein EDB91DRAFT_1147085 [Suillus paluster]
MFTSPSIIFVLSFLAGANACVQCPATLNVCGSAKKLYDAFTNGQFTYCTYDHVPPESSSVFCTYHTGNGESAGGYESCPATATVQDHCSA